MRILASIFVVLGLLMTIGGVMGLSVGSKSAPIRLIIGLVLIGIAFALRPKKKIENKG